MEATATPDPFSAFTPGLERLTSHPVIREPVTPAAVSRQERSDLSGTRRRHSPTPAFPCTYASHPHFHLPQEALP